MEDKKNTYFPLKELYNKGNTCYINSALQILYSCTQSGFHTEPLNLIRGDIARSIARLFRREGKIDEVIEKIYRRWNVHQQQDAGDFIDWIFKQVDEQGDGKLLDHFTLGQIECSGCSTCGHPIDVRPNKQRMLFVMQQGEALQEMLDNYFKNSGTCIKCRSFMKYTVKHVPLPKYLLIRTDEEYGPTIPTRDYFVTITDQCYQVYAVSLHNGDFRSGHYRTIVKKHDNDEWLECDDSRVTKLANSNVVRARAKVIALQAVVTLVPEIARDSLEKENIKLKAKVKQLEEVQQKIIQDYQTREQATQRKFDDVQNELNTIKQLFYESQKAKEKLEGENKTLERELKTSKASANDYKEGYSILQSTVEAERQEHCRMQADLQKQKNELSAKLAIVEEDSKQFTEALDHMRASDHSRDTSQDKSLPYQQPSDPDEFHRPTIVGQHGWIEENPVQIHYSFENMDCTV
jgi:hypothetical protein